MLVLKKSAGSELSQFLSIASHQENCKAIQGKRCGMLTSGIGLLCDDEMLTSEH
jgi:hypothetical protein